MYKLLLTLTLLIATACQQSTEKKLFDAEKSPEVKKEDEKRTPKNPDFKYMTSEPSFDMLSKQYSGPSLKKTKSMKNNLRIININFERTIHLNGVIDKNALIAADSIKTLSAKSSEPIYILIDSPGGSVFDGARTVAAIQNSRAPIYTICTRFCASMAFIIHQYGTRRFMLDRTLLMSHFASTGTRGDVDRIKSYIEVLQKYVDRFSAEIAERAGLSLEKYTNMISKDLWMTEGQAEKLGFSDGTINVRH